MDVHLRQRLLHPLNVSARTPHEIIALTPVRPQPADLLRRPKRTNFAIARRCGTSSAIGSSARRSCARQILQLPGIHRVALQTRLFEYVVHRHPLHPSRLHRDGLDPALLRPFGHRLQLRCGAPGAPHRLAVALRRYIGGFVAYIDPSGIRMHRLQAEVMSRIASTGFVCLLLIASCGLEQQEIKLNPE
jgi:hypothetical protein